MADMDGAFHLTESGNAEIAFQWLLMAIRARYHAVDARLRDFLLTVGRQKFIKPLYQELMETPTNAAVVREVYTEARPRYHPIAQKMIDGIVLGAGRL